MVTKAAMAIAAVVLAVGGYCVGISHAVSQTPDCPTEDSCTISYTGPGGWYIDEEAGR